MTFNYDEAKRAETPEARRKTNWLKALLPVIGLLLIGAAGAIAWALSDIGYQLIINNIAGIPQTPELQIVVGIIIFLVMIMLYAMIYAVFAPKPERSASESELDRDKQQKAKEAERAKRRKREMRAKMKQRNR